MSTCRHGIKGWCFDDATPQARRDADFLHRSAYDYALPYDGRELAEEYATWLVSESYIDGEIDLEGSHRADFERFLQSRLSTGSRIAQPERLS